MNCITTWAKRAAFPAVLALLLAGAGARADDDALTIDRALRKQAPEVLKYLREHEYKNVGVLKFVAGQDPNHLRDDLGVLNRTLADRLEVALVLGLTDEDEKRLGIVSHASDVAASSGNPRLTHRTADGRALFFDPATGLRFQRAWGKTTPVAADAFLTGEAVIAPDWRSIRLRIQVFDAKDPEELKTIGDWFKAAVDPRTLTECNVSFAHKKGAKDDEDDTPTQQIDRLALNIPSYPSTPTPQKVKDQEQDWTEIRKNSPVKFDILYNDKPVAIKDGAVETPKPDDVVTFKLENTDENDTFGVVVKVNGESTIEHQKLPAIDCYKWVLKPKQKIKLEGFQKGDENEEKFKVLTASASQGAEVNYGDNAGVFSLDVFRNLRPGEEAVAQKEEKRNQDVKAISRGSLEYKSAKPPRSLLALQGALTAEADPERSSHSGTKGLIEGGQLGASAIERVTFTPFPREVLSLVVRYYQPGK